MGITAAIAAGLTDIGVDAGFAGTIAPTLLGVGEGALGGAALGEITTGKPLTGALEGGVTGGVLAGAGPAISDATGLGLTGTDALLGSGIGAVGGAITGTSPLTGALEGGAGGLLTGALGGPASTTDASAPGVSGGAPLGTAPGGSTLGSASGSGLGGGAAGPAAPIGPTLGAGFSPGAASGADGVLQQLGAAPAPGGSAFTGLVDDSGPSLGVAPSGSAASANSQFLNATPANAGTDVTDTGGGVSGILKSLGIGSGSDDWISPGTLGKVGLGGAAAIHALTQPGISSLPGYSALNTEASTLGPQGAQLASYVNSGTLPPGAKTAVDQATQQAVATIRSKYASMGTSGSTEEASAIASVQQQSAEEGFSIANQLLASGISESGLASGIYQSILQANVSQNNEVISAISGLAGALGGGGTTVKLAA